MPSPGEAYRSDEYDPLRFPIDHEDNRPTAPRPDMICGCVPLITVEEDRRRKAGAFEADGEPASRVGTHTTAPEALAPARLALKHVQVATV